MSAEITETGNLDMSNAKRLIANLFCACGNLADEVVISSSTINFKTVKCRTMDILEWSIQIAVLFGINLYESCVRKLALNNRKYPINLCHEKVTRTTDIPNLFQATY